MVINLSKHTKKISTKRKRKLKLELIKRIRDNFIDGKSDSDCIECYWCHTELKLEEVTLDHLQELSDRGRWYDINNLVISCADCNNLRSNDIKKFKEKIG